MFNTCTIKFKKGAQRIFSHTEVNEMRVIGRKLPLFLVLLLILPGAFMLSRDAAGDGGFIPVKPVEVFEPGQNGIVCWNSTHERFILSIDVSAEEATQGLHVVPFPSLPSVTLGNMTIFDNLTAVFMSTVLWDEKYEGGYNDGGGAGAAPGNGSPVDIEVHEMIGPHDLSVIKVNDPSGFQYAISGVLEDLGIPSHYWPPEMNQVVTNYVRRGYCHFALDMLSVTRNTSTIEPLVYEFQTKEAVFPLEISSILEGECEISVAMIVPEDLPLDLSDALDDLEMKGEGKISNFHVGSIDGDLSEMFAADCYGLLFNGMVDLPSLKGDLVVKEDKDTLWMSCTNEYNPLGVKVFTRNDGSSRMYSYSRRPYYYDDWEYRMFEEPWITCREADTGSLLWEVYLLRSDDVWWMDRDLLVEDMDGDGTEEVVVMDNTYNVCFLTCLDPSDGHQLWNVRSDHLYSLYPTLIRNGQGSPHIILSTSYRNLLLIDVGSGETRTASFPDRLGSYTRSWVIPRIDGDRIVITSHNYDGVEKTWYFDPWVLFHLKDDAWWVQGWDQMTDEVVRTYSGYHAVHLGSTVTTRRLGTNESTRWNLDGREYMGLLGDQMMEGGSCVLLLEGQGELGRFQCADTFTGEIRWSTLVREIEIENPRVETADLDRDIYSEVILKTGYWEESVYAIDHDGSSVMFYPSECTGRGMDMDTDGLSELVLVEGYSLIMMEPFTEEVTFDLEDHMDNDGNDIQQCIVSDVNNDGFMDSILKGSEFSIYLDGSMGVMEGYFSRFGNIKYLEVKDNSEGEKFILIDLGERYYCIGNRRTVEIHCAGEEFISGSRIPIIVSVENGGYPVRDADLIWTSDIGGTFSGTTQIMPGLYFLEWTTPLDYTGYASVEVEVQSPVLSCPRGRYQFLLVNEQDHSSKGKLQVEGRFLPDVVQTGHQTSFVVSLEGYEGTSLELSLAGMPSSEEVLPFMSIGNATWITTYTVDLPGTYYPELVVTINGKDIWRGLYVLIVEDDPDPSAQGSVLFIPGRSEVHVGESVQVLMMVPPDYPLETLEVVCNSEYLSDLIRLSERVWVTTFTAPDLSGHLSIPIEIHLGKYAYETVYLEIDVTGDAGMPVGSGTVVGNLTVRCNVTKRYASGPNIMDIFICIIEEELPKEIGSYRVVDCSPGWTVTVPVQDREDELHLTLTTEGETIGYVRLWVYDKEGIGDEVLIRLDPSPEGEGGGVVTDDEGEGSPTDGPSDPDGDDGGIEPALMIASIIVIAIVLIGGSLLLVLIERRQKDSEVFWKDRDT